MYLNPEAEELYSYGQDVDSMNTYVKSGDKYIKTNSHQPTHHYGALPVYNGHSIARCAGHSNKGALTTVNGDIRFYGATSYKAVCLGHDFVFDLGGTAGIPKTAKLTEQPPTPKAKPFITVGVDAFLGLNKYLPQPKPYPVFKIPQYVDIAWPDMNAPEDVPAKFWVELVKLIPKESDVLVSCQGGHGRTGSFIALMAVFIDKMKGQDAIDLVRKNYCDNAIETKSQEEYIIRMAGGK